MSSPLAPAVRRSARLALLSLGFLAASPGMAQTSPPSLPGGGAPVQPVPLDGGLGLLALAGGAYGLRQLRRHRDRSEP